ncbi:MAG: iron chaperone [Acidimicrobiia bacterium]
MPDQIQTIDDYILSTPTEVRPILEELRRTIKKAAPGTEEKISYKMPAIELNGRYLVYFAAWKHHIALYPIPPLDEALEQEVARYRSGKDTLRLPLNEPVPYGLVERIVTRLVRKG